MDKTWTIFLLFAAVLLLTYVLTWKSTTGTPGNDLKYHTVIQPKEVKNVTTHFGDLGIFSKFNRDYAPGLDVNCLSTIPKHLIETSKESPVIIPRLAILQDLNINVLTCLYHRYLQTLQRHCTFPTRVGNLKTGGWNVCTDPEAEPTKPCLVYSFSDERNYGTFAEEMAKIYKCKVYMYNPKLENKTVLENLKRVHLKLGVDNGLSVEDLKTRLKEKSQNNINVLTLDTNNREWDVLPKLLDSGILAKTEQLLVRLHSSRGDTTVEHYIKRLVVLRDLYNTGFRIFWSDRDVACLHQTKKVTGCYYINLIRIMNRPSPIVIPSEPAFSQMTNHEYSQLFVRYVNSVQIPCKELIRLGKLPDGGWDVCHDSMFRPRKSCLVYSFGINNDFSFDDDAAKTYGCKVYSFDPSMKKEDHQHAENVMFYKTGISNRNGYVKMGKSNWKMRNLFTIMEDLGQANRLIDILKMDVEQSEWNSIPQMISSGALNHVRQFAFELHTGVLADNSKKYKQGLELLRSLYEAGFRIFWTHRNLACSYRTKKGEKRTQCYEIYFVNIR